MRQEAMCDTACDTDRWSFPAVSPNSCVTFQTIEDINSQVRVHLGTPIVPAIRPANGKNIVLAPTKLTKTMLTKTMACFLRTLNPPLLRFAVPSSSSCSACSTAGGDSSSSHGYPEGCSGTGVSITSAMSGVDSPFDSMSSSPWSW